jgi:CheY-like chemotaxis protein
MSHELRTPLNSILGLSESLLEQRRGLLNERQQNSLQIIESSGHHLLALINDILDLSKIEAGKFDFYPESFAVDELCRSSLAFIKAQAAKKSITVTYRNEASAAEIYADSRRLKQILVNLLNNAVKFTPEHGHVALRVNTQSEQDLIQFSVIDTGVGIAPEDLQRLFQPFVQVDNSLNRHHEGTGLGLALVRKLTDLHGGSVRVESEVGKGSRFTINIPCDCAPGNKAKFATLPSPSAAVVSPQLNGVGTPSDAAGTRAVILLAEDHMPNVLTIGEYLESYDYKVVVAHDGLEAVAKAEECKPDCILMDIQMPVMNGLAAISQLRTDPRFATTPIIALTALAMPGDRERCLAAGADEYMSKPVSLKALKRTITTMIRQKK